jgi:hypothetical protein
MTIAALEPRVHLCGMAVVPWISVREISQCPKDLADIIRRLVPPDYIHYPLFWWADSPDRKDASVGIGTTSSLSELAILRKNMSPTAIPGFLG